MNKKVFFFDFDGTLFFQGKFGNKTIEALNELHKQGHYLFYNSGRSLISTPKHILTNIPFDGFLCGGSYFEFHDKLIYHKTMSKEVINRVIDITKELQLDTVFEGENYICKYKTSAGMDSPYFPSLLDIEHLKDTEKYRITKLSIYHKTNELGEKIPLPEKAYEVLGLDFDICEFNHYSECFLKGTGKGIILKQVLSYLDIKKEDSYAFGDSYNDLTMLKEAGHAIVIGHAPQDCKNCAEYVTTEEVNGVAEALAFYGFYGGYR